MLNNIPEVQSPLSKKQKKALVQALVATTAHCPLKIYVGSCPDYSHANGLYTHQSVGEEVPLLSQIHLKIDVEVLKVLDLVNIPYEFVVMVADVEAIDQVFCDKFAGGNPQEFLRRCVSSSKATQTLMNTVKQENGLNGVLRSSTFFNEFGKDKFVNTQNLYEHVLRERYRLDNSFSARVVGDIVARGDMYRRMYDQVLKLPNVDYQEFLVDRDVRTKAQYLALGRLICESAENAIIINHPTTNIGFFNDRNKFLLPNDGPQPQRAIPIFEMQQKVY